MSRFTLASWSWRRSSLFSSRASIISWTSWEAVVKWTLRPFWQAAGPDGAALAADLLDPLGVALREVLAGSRGAARDAAARAERGVSGSWAEVGVGAADGRVWMRLAAISGREG